MSSTDDLLPTLVLILGTALLLTLLVAYAAYKCTTEQLRTAKVVPSAQADAPPAPGQQVLCRPDANFARAQGGEAFDAFITVCI